MIEKTNEGYKFNTANMTEENILLIKELPEWLTNHLANEEIHIAMIRNILHCYGYTLANGKYT
ncbi:MAG: hypothetical protein K0R54_5086 [Clostridiaceae bacterium]|jgi:hemerythrin|nr:hypothetical protein [Clostridiaceae bacterium]